MGLGYLTGVLVVRHCRECLDRLNQTKVDAPAACHSGVGTENSPQPPQVMSPNVGKEQTHDNEQVHGP